MMEIIFLLGWTGLFLGVLFFVWRKVLSRTRPYLMLVINFFFLAGVFYFFELRAVGL